MSDRGSSAARVGMPVRHLNKRAIRLGLAGLLSAIAVTGWVPDRAWADTLESALALAYTNNPLLKAHGSPRLRRLTAGSRPPIGHGRPRAKSPARETLRLLTQQVLLDAATAYMDVLRDGAILELQRRNVEVLQEQLRQTRDRFTVGEVTRTDVAQAQTRLTAAHSQLLIAQSNYTSSRAQYRLVIGNEPGILEPGAPVDRLSPHTVEAAVAQAMAEHPSVTAAMYEVSALRVKIAQGQAQRQFETSFLGLISSTSIVGQPTTPLDQGGIEYSTIRQKRLDLDSARNQARATVVQSWVQLFAAKVQIPATKAQETAAEIALNGVREESRVGQRTTLDVLNSEQELVEARVARVTAERDRVVASYALAAAVGRLSVEALGLNAPVHDERVHYHQARDSRADPDADSDR